MSQVKLTADSGGGTVAIKAPASTTGNAALDLTVPGTASATLDTLKRAGNILQVKQAVKTDTASSSSATFADISGLSVSITPASTSNKILVECRVCSGGEGDSFQAFKVLRDSTAIGLGTGGSGNQTNVSFGISSPNATTHQYAIRYGVFSFLDSPSSTSALTYKIQWSSIYNSNTSYINRPNTVGDNAYNLFGSSTITVSEVAA